MIRVKIELDQFGSGNVISFWAMDIWNNLSGNKQVGNYYFKIYKKNSRETVWKDGEVKNFKRLRWSVWYLLYLCLKTIYGDNHED